MNQKLPAPAQIVVGVTWHLLRALFCLSTDRAAKSQLVFFSIILLTGGRHGSNGSPGTHFMWTLTVLLYSIKNWMSRGRLDRKEELNVINTRTKNWGDVLRHICLNFLSTILRASGFTALVAHNHFTVGRKSDELLLLYYDRSCWAEGLIIASALDVWE